MFAAGASLQVAQARHGDDRHGSMGGSWTPPWLHSALGIYSCCAALHNIQGWRTDAYSSVTWKMQRWQVASRSLQSNSEPFTITWINEFKKGLDMVCLLHFIALVILILLEYKVCICVSATVWEEKKWLITSYCLKSHVLVKFPFCLCLLKTQVATFFPKFNGNDLSVTVMLHWHSDTVCTQGMLNNKKFLGIRVILNCVPLPTPVKGDTPPHLLPRWRKLWEAQPSWLSTPSALSASQEEERHRSGDFGRANGRHNLSLPLPSW